MGLFSLCSVLHLILFNSPDLLHLKIYCCRSYRAPSAACSHTIGFIYTIRIYPLYTDVVIKFLSSVITVSNLSVKYTPLYKGLWVKRATKGQR